MSRMIAAATIRHPQIIGWRAPKRCSSRSPTRMNATMLIGVPEGQQPCLLGAQAAADLDERHRDDDDARPRR